MPHVLKDIIRISFYGHRLAMPRDAFEKATMRLMTSAKLVSSLSAWPEWR